MPQANTKSPAKPSKAVKVTTNIAAERPTLSEAGILIGKMYGYEEAARKQGIDLTASRFKNLTKAEQQFIRAELVADYIRLSAGNTGRTPVFYEDALSHFCEKICDMGIPSQELIGTYLAALDVVSTDERLSKIDWLHSAVRGTMVSVLQSCVDLLQQKKLS